MLTLHKNKLLNYISVEKKLTVAKADSGATNHYWRPEDASCLLNLQKTLCPAVTLPDGNTLQPSQQGTLPFPTSLSLDARRATILDGLKSASLVSLGQLCDNKCKVLLDANDLYVVKDNKLVLKGDRNKCDGLWDIPLHNPNPLQASYQQPTIHPSIYPNKVCSTQVYTNPSFQSPSPSEPPSFTRLFQEMEGIIALNECEYEINGQLKQDRRDKHQLNVIIRKQQTKEDLAKFLHAACFSPVKSTFIKAINNNHFTTWPGLNSPLIQKHLRPSIATTKGHLKQEKQGLQSTKTSTVFQPSLDDVKQRVAKLQAKVDPTTSLGDAITQDVHDDAFPPSEAPNTRTNAIYYKICSMAPKHLAYTDLTGRFPYRSSRGNQYIMVAYSYDSSAILAKAINNRSASSITSAWKYLHDKLHVAGVKPETWVLDNETSNLLTTTMKDNDTTYQLVPPHIHRANLAERAIQTFKDHLKAGLASLDPDFPLYEWDRILDQCILTLNLLRSARLNPKLSAHAFLFGQFDYNKTPIAPPGIKVIAHKKPSVRGTWAPNGEEGWYVGPAPLHYRCMTIYFPKTRAERQTDTLTFFPHHISVPEVASIDFLKQAALDIISILSSPAPSLPLSLEAGDTTKNALLKIAEALGTVKDRPVLAPNPTQLPRVQVKEKPTSCSPRVLNKPSHNDMTTKVNPTVPTWKPGSAPFLQTKYNLRSRKVQPQPTQSLLAQHIFSTHTASHIYNSDGHKETINSLLFGPAHEVWQQAMSNEWGRLAQGNDNGINFTDTIDFIHRHDVPSQQKVTYGSFVCNFKPLKKEQYRIRLVAGGDILMYDEDTGAPAPSLIETKLLINSVISDSKQGAKFLSCDLKDFFLATPMEKAEYMKVQYK